mgnify:CR=1 FL=1
MLTDDEVRNLPRDMLKKWPEDLSRPAPKNWTGSNPRLVFARSVHEVDLYPTYRRVIAEAFDQRAYLWRQFTGACVTKSRVEQAIATLFKSVEGGVRLLRTGEFSVGEVGMADLGGFLVLDVNGVKVPVVLQVEVKAKGGTEREDQTTRREALVRKGVCAILADDVDDAVAQIRAYKDRMEKALAGARA